MNTPPGSVDASATGKWHRLLLAALLLFTLFSALLCARWGLPDGVTVETSSPWAVDSIAPLGPLNEAYHKFTRDGVDDVIYPLFHYVVLAGTLAPYIGLSLATGALQDPHPDIEHRGCDLVVVVERAVDEPALGQARFGPRRRGPGTSRRGRA